MIRGRASLKSGITLNAEEQEMKSARLFSLGVFILIFAFSTLLYAAVPQKINYQGKLTTPTGALIDSAGLSMVFSIYDNEPDVSPAWAETLAVDVEKGIFSVVLGNILPLPPNLLMGLSSTWESRLAPIRR